MTYDLFNACEKGDFQRIERYFHDRSSSEINSIRDENGATLVHYVSRYGHTNLFQYFLQMKDLNLGQLRTEHGATPLHDAAVCDQKEILQLIFKDPKETNVRWNIRDDQGNTPLHLAACYNSLNVLHYLVDEELADPHIRSYNGFQPIHYASLHGHISSIKFLLSKSADTINCQTNECLTPLHLAVQQGSLETIQILISRGANWKIKDQNGSNSLHIACENNHSHIVQWFIEKQQADINQTDYKKWTLIHHAARIGSDQIINYLLEKNAQITSTNDGYTPLHLAAENGHQNVCAILIERGCCSLNCLNNEKFTAADLAERHGYFSLANELRLRANSLKSPSIQLEKATIVRLVIKKRNVPRTTVSTQVNEEDLPQ